MPTVDYSKWDALDSDDEAASAKAAPAAAAARVAAPPVAPVVPPAAASGATSTAVGGMLGGGGLQAAMQLAASGGKKMSDEASGPHAEVEKMKQAGNEAFKKAQMLKQTTAGKQYLHEAKCSYIDAIKALSRSQVDDKGQELMCTLHTNLAQVHLIEAPPNYQSAKAAAEIALHVNPKSVKAFYRKAQALLEDNREGLPEDALRAALDCLNSAAELESNNAQIVGEAKRVRRRLEAIEETRRVLEPGEIVARVNKGLLQRGASCLELHGYVWGQTDEIVHVFFPVRGARLAKASEATCEIKPRSLRVVLPCPEGRPSFEVKGQLLKAVRPDDCSWQLEDSGLLLHVELAKRDAGEQAGHWERVWQEHLECKVPSPEEQKLLDQVKAVANLPNREAKPQHPKAEETVRRLREMCPGVDVEWGDTSLAEYR